MSCLDLGNVGTRYRAAFGEACLGEVASTFTDTAQAFADTNVGRVIVVAGGIGLPAVGLEMFRVRRARVQQEGLPSCRERLDSIEDANKLAP